jgi:hypothetical protein
VVKKYLDLAVAVVAAVFAVKKAVDELRRIRAERAA